MDAITTHYSQAELSNLIAAVKPGYRSRTVATSAWHLTLKKEAIRPLARNFLQQQAKFDDFIECYNHERPHQVLNMRHPAELYRASPRPYRDHQVFT